MKLDLKITKPLAISDLRGVFVTPAGFEPATFGAEIRNSIQLNYGAISAANIAVNLICGLSILS